MKGMQGGFRLGRSCIDNIFCLNELIQGRIKEGISTYIFFLDFKKAYDTVWRDGLWYKMWGMDIKGKMRRVVRSLNVNNRSCTFLEGKSSDYFSINTYICMYIYIYIHIYIYISKTTLPG